MTTIPGPSGVAAMRAARALLNRPAVAVEALADEHGRTFALHLGPTAIVVVGDRAAIEVLLTGPQERYRWGPMFRIPLGVFVGPSSILVSDGEEHARRRSLVQPAFALRRLHTWRPLVLAEVDRMIDGLPVGETVDLAPRIRTTVRRVVVRVLFGDELDPDEIGAALAPAAEYVNRPFSRQMPHPLPLGARQRARVSRRAFDRILDAEIDRRVAAAEAPRDDVLAALLATDGLSRSEVRDQVVSLIGAGYDSTTATASWLVLRAAADQGVWRRLGDEAAGAAPDDARPWADAVVHESLRLHPAGTFAPRLVAQSFDLGPGRVRRGSVVAWSPMLAGRDPESWPDPMRFDPERHLARDPDAYAWVPFGAGSRSCLGFGLARMNLTILASRLAQRTVLRCVEPGFPAPIGTVTVHPEGGVRVAVVERR